MLPFENSFGGPYIWSVSRFTIAVLHDFYLFNVFFSKEYITHT